MIPAIAPSQTAHSSEQQNMENSSLNNIGNNSNNSGVVYSFTFSFDRNRLRNSGFVHFSVDHDSGVRVDTDIPSIKADFNILGCSQTQEQTQRQNTTNTDTANKREKEAKIQNEDDKEHDQDINSAINLRQHPNKGRAIENVSKQLESEKQIVQQDLDGRDLTTTVANVCNVSDIVGHSGKQTAIPQPNKQKKKETKLSIKEAESQSVVQNTATDPAANVKQSKKKKNKANSSADNKINNTANTNDAALMTTTADADTAITAVKEKDNAKQEKQHLRDTNPLETIVKGDSNEKQNDETTAPCKMEKVETQIRAHNQKENQSINKVDSDNSIGIEAKPVNFNAEEKKNLTETKTVTKEKKEKQMQQKKDQKAKKSLLQTTTNRFASTRSIFASSAQDISDTKQYSSGVKETIHQHQNISVSGITSGTTTTDNTTPAYDNTTKKDTSTDNTKKDTAEENHDTSNENENNKDESNINNIGSVTTTQSNIWAKVFKTDRCCTLESSSSSLYSLSSNENSPVGSRSSSRANDGKKSENDKMEQLLLKNNKETNDKAGAIDTLPQVEDFQKKNDEERKKQDLIESRLELEMEKEKQREMELRKRIEESRNRFVIIKDPNEKVLLNEINKKNENYSLLSLSSNSENKEEQQQSKQAVSTKKENDSIPKISNLDGIEINIKNNSYKKEETALLPFSVTNEVTPVPATTNFKDIVNAKEKAGKLIDSGDNLDSLKMAISNSPKTIKTPNAIISPPFSTELSQHLSQKKITQQPASAAIPPLNPEEQKQKIVAIPQNSIIESTVKGFFDTYDNTGDDQNNVGESSQHSIHCAVQTPQIKDDCELLAFDEEINIQPGSEDEQFDYDMANRDYVPVKALSTRIQKPINFFSQGIVRDDEIANNSRPTKSSQNIVPSIQSVYSTLNPTVTTNNAKDNKKEVEQQTKKGEYKKREESSDSSNSDSDSSKSNSSSENSDSSSDSESSDNPRKKILTEAKKQVKKEIGLDKSKLIVNKQFTLGDLVKNPDILKINALKSIDATKSRDSEPIMQKQTKLIFDKFKPVIRLDK